MDGSIFLRAALLQAVTVAAAAVGLSLALPHTFFESWGWLAGPLAWIVCAGLTALALQLPALRVLSGAVLAGLLSLAAVLLGLHWLGVAVAIAAFAAWCARIAGRPRRAAWS